MADTAIKTEEGKMEYFDTPEELDTKVTQFAQLVRECENMVCFTGAGISTSTGIPDYRSGFNTVLETGPGCWEKAAKREQWKKDALRAGRPLPIAMRMPFNKTIQEARPSPTHMAMVALENQDKLKFIISQNIDGLHRRSGIHPNKLAELHGNTNLEVCIKCSRQHMRDYRVRTAQKAKEHKTGRTCDTPGCGGELKDTIINFGESLDQFIIQKATAVSMVADLHVCMGSSMRVSPANQMPMMTRMGGGKVVMINLQKTPVDEISDLVIHERIDKVMELLMQKLEIPIPEFRRSYRLKLSLPADGQKMEITGVDTNGDCYTLFKSLKVTGLSAQPVVLPKRAADKQPFAQAVPQAEDAKVKILCEFQGHYAEPKIELTVPMDKLREAKSIEFEIIYHVTNKTFESIKMWKVDGREALGDATFNSIAVPRRESSAERPAATKASAAASRMNALQRGGAAATNNRAGSQKNVAARPGQRNLSQNRARNAVAQPARPNVAAKATVSPKRPGAAAPVSPKRTGAAVGASPKRQGGSAKRAAAGGLGTFAGAKKALGGQMNSLAAANTEEEKKE